MSGQNHPIAEDCSHHSQRLTSLVAEQARRRGPLAFDEVIDLALYHPELGFYAAGAGGGAGRGHQSHFLTSPEVGALFGAVVARALDAWWTELGRPDPFVVVEAGAGAGTLARSVLGAHPACASALRYVLVERSAVLRERQQVGLSLEPAQLALGPVAVGSDPDEDPRPVAAIGPLAVALTELPAVTFTGVILANELLDNVAFRLLEHSCDHHGAWYEVRVAEDPNRPGHLVETLVPAAAGLVAEAGRLAPNAPPGARIPLHHQGVAWLRSALRLVERGRVVVIDYADTTPSLASRPWRTWVRTYRSHGPGQEPLQALGTQDITCEVAVDQLSSVRVVSAERSQAEFLAAHGLDQLVAEARAHWQARAHLGDLEALAARSRIIEAQALTDPSGLGAHRVLEWVVS